jgi:catechol 2,3-dioxygenase-like lactoylglutathione lyase family enzyme
MSIRLNHVALPARDATATAAFTADILGAPAPRRAGPFVVVDLDDDESIDYAEPPVASHGQHVAFLVDDARFDGILERLRARGVTFWADPRMTRPGEINHNHGGRGVYFDDPAGNHLECITAPYAKS